VQRTPRTWSCSGISLPLPLQWWKRLTRNVNLSSPSESIPHPATTPFRWSRNFGAFSNEATRSAPSPSQRGRTLRPRRLRYPGLVRVSSLHRDPRAGPPHSVNAHCGSGGGDCHPSDGHAVDPRWSSPMSGCTVKTLRLKGRGYSTTHRLVACDRRDVRKLRLSCSMLRKARKPQLRVAVKCRSRIVPRAVHESSSPHPRVGPSAFMLFKPLLTLSKIAGLRWFLIMPAGKRTCLW